MLLNYFAYLSILIFVAVIIYRLFRIFNTPVHLRWELYPVMHEAGGKAKYGGSYLEEVNWWTKRIEGSKVSEMTFMIPEILFLKGVWESNKSLWFWSWSFHFALYTLIGSSFLVILTAIFGAESSIGEILMPIAGYLGLAANILGVIGCLGMLYKRLFDFDLGRYAAFGTYFNLLFILAIFGTGLYADWKLGATEVASQLTVYLSNMATLASSVGISGMVSTHLILIYAFMIYLPFTHMAHFIIKWFTWHDVRWNDKPNFKGSKLEKQIGKALSYKPTWAAAHIKADGKKNWGDIATEEIGQNEKEA